MKITNKVTKLTKVKDIVIPDRFFNRMSTGYTELDQVFGNGILPGLTFTLTAPPGVGKSSYLLQVLEALEQQGFSTTYITGEEDIRQVAYNCKRLNVSNISITNETNIDKIEQFCSQSDIVIIDSFPCITTNNEMNSRAHEKYVTNRIIEMSEKYNCAIGIILHITKSGSYKGSTYIAHAVGANFQLEVNPDDDSYRTLTSSKNRYGATMSVNIPFGYNGYNFEVVEKQTTSESKANKGDEQLEQVMKLADMKNIRKSDLINTMNINSTKAYTLLKELTDAGKLEKVGRGDGSFWRKSNIKLQVGNI